MAQITTISSPSEGGITSGGGEYASGATIVISQTAAQDYDFMGWVCSTGSMEVTSSFPYVVGESNVVWTAQYHKRNYANGKLIWKDS